MLMLSLDNYIGSVHVSAAAVLGPPRLSLVETRDDTHLKPVLIPTPPVTHVMCMCIQSQ